MTVSTEIKTRIGEFVSTLQAYHDAETPRRYPGLKPDRIGIQYGQKLAKVIKTNQYDRDGVIIDGQTSVYCFIDLSNGDILKAAGWKAPAKGKRGSIFNEGCDIGNDRPCDLHGGGLYR